MFLPPFGYLLTQNIIFDIGTKILFLQSNDHSATPNGPFGGLRPDSESWDRDLQSGSVKTRFKAIFQMSKVWFCSLAQRWYALPKKQYLTVGPKFFFCNKMITARRPMDLFEIWDLIPAAGIETYNLAVSKHDLKPSATFFRKFACDLGFAAYVFHGLFAPGGRLNHEAYMCIYR